MLPKSLKGIHTPTIQANNLLVIAHIELLPHPLTNLEQLFEPLRHCPLLVELEYHTLLCIESMVDRVTVLRNRGEQRVEMVQGCVDVMQGRMKAMDRFRRLDERAV